MIFGHPKTLPKRSQAPKPIFWAHIFLFDRHIFLFDGKMFLFDGNTRAGA